MKRLMWLSSSWVLLLPLLAGGLLVFTEIGSRWALENTGRILGLEVEYENGTLAGELEIRRLAWTGDSVSVELGDTVLQLSPGCLWRSSVCFQQLFARSLTIAMVSDSAGEAASADADDLLIEFPVPLVAKSLLLETLSVTWDGGEWRQGSIEAAVEISGSRIWISRAVIHDANLALLDTGGSGQSFELPEISLPLELQVDELVLEQGSWDLYGNVGELQSLVLKGSWLRNTLQLEALHLNSAELGRWNAAAGIEFSGKWPLNAKGAGELSQIDGWPELLQRNISFDVTGGLDALAVQADITGRITVSANTVLNVLDSQLPFQLQATLDWPDKLLLSELLELPEAIAATTLTAPLSLVASGDLQEQVFQLQLSADVPVYPELGLQLAGSHRSGNLQIDDLRLQDQAGANTLWASGAVDYGDTIRISALLESSALDLAISDDYGSGSLKGQLRLLANLDGERWDVAISEVNIKGEMGGVPALVSGYAGINSQLQLLASDLHADVNGSQLTLNTPGDRSGPASAHLSVDDLSVWLPDSHGKLSLQALVAQDWEELSLSGTAEDIHWQDLTIASGDISGDYQPAGDGRFRLDILLANTTIGKIELGDTALSAHGTALEQTASLRTQGDIAGALELTGKIDGEGDWRGQLASTTLETEQGNWHLQAPVAVHIAVARPQMRLEAHCWNFQQTQVCPGETLLGEEGSASMSLDGNLDELSVFLPEYLELKGALAASFKASWAKGQALVLDGDARGRDITFTRHYGEGEFGSVDWERLDLDVHKGAEGLSLEAALYRAQKEIAGIDLRLPVDRNAPISGRVDVSNLQLAMFAPFTPVMSALRGELRGSLQLRGTIDKPLADGTLYLSGGQFSLLGNPTELAQFELQLDARGNSAVVQGSGLLGGGELSFTGDLASQPEWSLQLKIDGDNHEILLPPYTQMKVSETLTVHLSPGLLDLKGNIEVHEGLLEHERLPDGSVTLSDDVVEVDYDGNVISELAPFDMRIDVGVLIRNEFRILGDMVSATLGGELKLRQSPRQPLQVFGNLNVIGGELRAYQQRLSIRRGTIAFSGTPDNPGLNVRAQRKINAENIVVGIYLSGTLKQPKLEVFSDPVLPDEQAMSYLVRGRGIDSGAAADGMAAALSVGSGLVNQTALVTELNRIPGISGLEFGAEGSTEEDTAATVGGYIGNRLYLSYGMGIYEPINVLTARLYLRTRLWLEVVSRLENSVDLYYSFDIK